MQTTDDDSGSGHFQWPAWLANRKEWQPAALATVSGSLIGLVGILTSIGMHLWWVYLILALLAVVSLCLAPAMWAARAQRAEREYLATEAAIETLQRYIDTLLYKDLHRLFLYVINALTSASADQRKRRCGEARTGAIVATRALVGKTDGTRANLFRYTETGGDHRFEAAPMAAFGGFRTSDRKFRQGDETFDATVAGTPRFEPYVTDLPYETYATFPVGNGYDQVYGVLTVDSPKSGDLDKEPTLALMSVLADVIALTIALEGCSSVRPGTMPDGWCAYNASTTP